MEFSNDSQVFRRPILEGAKYGYLQVWLPLGLSLLLSSIRIKLGLPIRTFYAIIGTSLGSIDFVTSAYLGFGLYLVMELFWSWHCEIPSESRTAKRCKNIFSPPELILMGIGTGILIWLILFLSIIALIFRLQWPNYCNPFRRQERQCRLDSQ